VTRRSLVAEVEEMFMIPTYASPRPFAPVAAHRALALPLPLRGSVHQWWAADSGRVRVVGIGRRKQLEPFARRLLGELSPIDGGGRSGLLSPARLGSWDGDLIMAGVHRWMAGRFRRAGWIIVPSAVRWSGSLESVPPKAVPRSLQENLKKILRQGFTLEQTSSRQSWSEFFTRMVAPQAQARHGSAAWVPSRHFRRKLEQVATLHMIVREGQRVAGACSVARGATVWLPLMGVRDGDPTLLRQGAGVAALALPLEWARARHFRRVDAGRTSPFLTDGIHRYKRNWGLTPVPDPLAQVVAVRPRTELGRRAFTEAPVLAESGSGLELFSGD
jgi:Acetyltransferase (GNAT) domain